MRCEILRLGNFFRQAKSSGKLQRKIYTHPTFIEGIQNEKVLRVNTGIVGVFACGER